MSQAVLRQRRQLTLPRQVCEQLAITTGDRLDLAVERGALVARPAKQRALDALREVQAAFGKAGVTEGELQAAVRRVRRKISAGRYGRKA